MNERNHVGAICVLINHLNSIKLIEIAFQSMLMIKIKSINV